jgi:hypothetical protein
MQKKLMIEITSFANSILELTISAPQGNLIMKLGAEACDPLAELGELLFDLHAVYEEPPQLGKDQPLYLFWDGDGGQYTWCLTPGHDKSITIEISFCKDTSDGNYPYPENELKLATVAQLDKLSDSLFSEMKKILKLHSFSGYRQHCHKRNFPLSLFLKLSHLSVNTTGKPSLDDDLIQLAQIFS